VVVRLVNSGDLAVSKELVGPKTRSEFREYFVGTSVGHVDDTFRGAGIRPKDGFEPPVSGARRGRVEQYYASIDFRTWGDVRRVLAVYEQVLDELEERKAHGVEADKAYAARKLDTLLRYLRRDGFVWSNGRIAPATQAAHLHEVRDAVESLQVPELARQLDRLRESVDSDPALAIGTAKEMLETACKTILDELGVQVQPEWDVPELLKHTRKHLKLLPDDVPEVARGADTIKRLLSSLGQVGHGLAELRNLYGSGHGRSGRVKGLSPRHARLAVGAATTLVQFLLDTHVERRSGTSNPASDSSSS
jgi:hypothetical protein